MDKIISFGKGIRRQPSIGEDGELSELVNLIPKNGELVNVRPMEDLGYVVNGTLVAVHEVYGNKNYIILKEGGIYFSNNNYSEHLVIETNNYRSITTVGKTLVIYCDDGMKYALWKDDRYETVDINQMRFSVSISGEKHYEQKGLFLDPVLYPEPNANNKVYLEENHRRELFNTVDSMIEEVRNEQGNPSIWHKYVTLGIAAMRMYDGSYIAYSDIFTLDPVQQNHGISGNLNKVVDSGPTVSGLTLGVTADVCLMKYAINVTSAIVNKDLISGIDFFITTPSAFLKFNKSMYMVLDSEIIWDIKSGPEIMKEISEMQFYKVYSIDINDMGNHTFYIPRATGGEMTLDLSAIPPFTFGSLNMLTYNGRLNMADIDYYHIPMRKVNLSQSPQPYMPDIDSKGYYDYASDSYDKDPVSNIANMTVDAAIEVDIQDPSVGKSTNRFYGKISYPLPPVLSYPSKYATKMRIYLDLPHRIDLVNLSEYFYAEFLMYPMAYGNMSIYASTGNKGLHYTQAHNVELAISNGSVTSFTPAINNGWSNAFEIPTETPLYVGSVNNSLMYSNYGNPFVIPPTNDVRIGNQKIVGISNAAKALSQGQFGKFPLYAFCTDGIWALEVSNDGGYRAVQPISRDVCNNKDSITQIDGAVVFTTAQGLKLIQGSDIMLLSQQMDGNNIREGEYFGENFFLNHGADEYDILVVEESRDFRDILANCKIAYDYPNQLLRIFPQQKKSDDGDIDTSVPYKYYVYSLSSREFASVVGDEFIIETELMPSPRSIITEWQGVHAVIHGYPSSLVQIGMNIYAFSSAVGEDMMRGLLLTRPIDMGEPFAMKKLQDMRLHYTKHNKAKGTFVKMVVYVSNDGEHWYVLPSLRKRSFKYYRVALITKMTDNDALSGMIMRYELERTNKIR